VIHQVLNKLNLSLSVKFNVVIHRVNKDQVMTGVAQRDKDRDKKNSILNTKSIAQPSFA
jgi:hypothetical protein